MIYCNRFSLAVLSAAALALPHALLADSTGTVTVQATASVYSPAGGTADGTAATSISLAPGTTYITFSLPEPNGSPQTISLNGGGNKNDPDGGNSAVGSSSNSGIGSQSGITAPGAGYLTGVFVDGTESGSAPASLNYTTTSSTSSLTSSPLLDQTFFIGDGLTGDASGVTQDFYAPAGATTLYLGISDAGGYNGSPGSYGDNIGSFSVNYDAVGSSAVTTGATPEPSSIALLGTGLVGAAGALRRRVRRA